MKTCCILVSILLAAGVAMGQQYSPAYRQDPRAASITPVRCCHGLVCDSCPACVPQATCAARPTCVCQPCAEPAEPQAQQAQPAAVAAMPVPGMFAQPPAVGRYAGETSSVGIRGFRIHIPELNFELPTIELPSFTRYRRNAEFEADQARAPWVVGPAASYAMIGAGGHMYSPQQLALMQEAYRRQALAQKQEAQKAQRAEEAATTKEGSEIEKLREENEKLKSDLEKIKKLLCQPTNVRARWGDMLSSPSSGRPEYQTMPVEVVDRISDAGATPTRSEHHGMAPPPPFRRKSTVSRVPDKNAGARQSSPSQGRPIPRAVVARSEEPATQECGVISKLASWLR